MGARVRRVVAMAWVLATIGGTFLLAPRMGARGWSWLGCNAVLCCLGAGHELFRQAGRSPR
jgi:hypothetical protein